MPKLPIERSDIRALMGMPPVEAVAYLKKKGLRIGWSWQETLDAAHARSFTVAKVARIDVLLDMKRELQQSLQLGFGQKEFIERLTPVLQKHGWWGKQVIVDQDSEAEVAQLGSPRRLRTIYQTNMQSAYMAGRYKSMLSAHNTHPYWRYVAVLDSKTRDAHRQLDGHVFSVDDGFTDFGYPPNGYNCRCRAQSISRERLQKLGIKPTEPKLETREVQAGINKRTGEVTRAKQTGFYLTDSKGRNIWVGPDVGFNSSPAASHILDDVLVDKAKQLVGDGSYAQAQQLLLNKPRMDAWKSFVRNTIDYGLQQRQTMTVGVMQAVEVGYVVNKAADVSPVIFVSDRLLQSPKGRRHADKGDALTKGEWLGLPHLLVKAKTVYWDTDDKHLVYLLDNGIIVAVRLGAQTVAGISEVATAYRLKESVLKQNIQTGKYIEIR